MTTNESSILAVEEFRQVLDSDIVIGPALAVRLALVAQDYGVEAQLSREEVSGIVIGAGAMYRALTGSHQ